MAQAPRQYVGLSYSVIGNEKKPATSLNRKSFDSEMISGFSRTNFANIKPLINFSKINLMKNKLKDLITSKPKLVDLTQYKSLGFKSNLVGYDPSVLLQENVNKPMSPRLINYVEPYTIEGMKKTMFFTEVNSGLNVGDRVFIINGNYDSDLLIKSDKYKAGRDGYKVLFVDKCRIVLDIDYNGLLPWLNEEDDNFIRVYFVDSIDDFISVEKAITTRGGVFDRKFNQAQNNIIYTNKNFGPINVWTNSTKIVEAPGFFVRTPTPILTIDDSFESGTGFNIGGQVYVIKRQNDDKYVVGGSFTSYNGTSANKIIRLNPNGSIDSIFSTGTGFDGNVETIEIQSDGKIIVGGRFTQYDGSSPFYTRMIRLNSNGSIDTTFLLNLGTINFLTEKVITSIVVNSSGRIYVSGSFYNVQGNSRRQIVRLLSTGIIDTTFNPGSGFNGSSQVLVKTLKLQSDGKILAGGNFTTYDGVNRRKIVRILTNGSADTTNFSGTGFPSNEIIEINSIDIQSDGSIVAGGNFTMFNSFPAKNIIRFSSSCVLDTPFLSNSAAVNLDQPIRKLIVNGNDIFVSGNFNNYSKVVKFDLDGTLDDSLQTSSNFNYTVYDMLFYGGKLVVGGDFSFFNNYQVRKIARLEDSNWQNITDKFIQGSFSTALSNSYYNNGKVKIFNGSFTYSINENIDFQKGFVYKYDMAEEPNNYMGTYSTWKVDVRYSRPILTKANFRDGNFDGDWNVGLFGRQDKKIKWEGNVSKWYTGTLLNTLWQKGNINSDYSLSESYFSEIDNDGVAYQKLNGPNNNGKGFNFIIDSDIIISEIENATIINSKLGISSTQSVIEKSLLKSSASYNVTVKRAFFEDCSFSNSNITNSELRSVRISNSVLENVKIVNSWIKKSLTKNSDYISDEIIKILNYDEFNINVMSNLSTATHKVFKFYISLKDYQRLNQRDSFYIKGLNVVDGQLKLLNFFDKKFKISSWQEYDDHLSNANQFYKRPVDCAAFLSTPEENAWTYTSIRYLSGTVSNRVISENQNKNYSIDIIYSLFDSSYLPVSNINFDRSSDIFQGWDEQTVLFNYYKNNTMITEIATASGIYNFKPYYILKENDSNTSTDTYVFWNSSQQKWQHRQIFSTMSGGSGYYYAYSDQPNYLPISGTYGWVPAPGWELFLENNIADNYYISSSIFYNPTPSLPTLLGDIIDIDNAYIIDSDYESGIIETTNWNSGFSINTNNDTNITKPTNEGGYYNLILQTSSSTILAKTGFNTNLREGDEDLLDVGSIFFLNSVYYDTRGKIYQYSITNQGSGYLDDTDVTTFGGLGTNSTFNITAYEIGAVTSVTISNPGNAYTQGPPGIGQYFNIGVTNISGVGTGLTVDIQVDSSGFITQAIIRNPGSGYLVNDIVSVNPNPTGVGSTLTIQNVSNGGIISATLSLGGIQYNNGDIINLSGGNGDAQITITSTTGSLTKLPDTYKVISRTLNQLELEEVISTTSSLTKLTDGGLFYTPLANNRYGYLHQLKMSKNFIKSGFLKRQYLKNNLLQNKEINLLDKDFNNILLFKNLVATDTLFTDNNNVLSKASYIQSNFTQGNDYWDDGLLYNSVWNGGIFRKGLIKESTWHDGTFVEGTFYQSRSFNASPTINYQYYDVDRIKNYWKSGKTSATVSNDRYSWRNGVFKKGEFLKSDWERGNFEDGKLYNSKWYAGTFSNGTIGDKNLNFEDTFYYNGLIKNAIVENAAVYGVDSSYKGLSTSAIVWETGVFNDGIFGCDIIEQKTASHTALWKNGTFNGGEFRTNGKWLTGVFNGGKFISGFGWTYSLTYDTISTSASQYAWETGEFNGGEFGLVSTATNSTWWSGEFNGGLFQGRYWNDGIFTNGRFRGSGTYSVIGGYTPDGMTVSNASMFTDSFSSSFYGIWGGGFVSDVKDEIVQDKKSFTIPTRSILSRLPKVSVSFDKSLWLSGTFSHPGGVVSNSVWLDGTFQRGRFKNSSFNPWVIRPGDNDYSFRISDDLINASGSCIWENGIFDDSEFYISQWKQGQFLSGTAFGMIWKDGVANYMNAYNVLWEDGTWKNGNWNGSYFIFNEDITPAFNKQIIFRGMSWADSPLLHVWNVFNEEIKENKIISAPANGLTYISYSAEQTQPQSPAVPFTFFNPPIGP
jgi:uncharacterized delta-60 repeat protein